MNATLQTAKTTVLQKTELPPVGKLIQGHRFNEAHYQKVMKENDDQSNTSSVYSLSRHHHHKRSSQHKKRRSTSNKRQQAARTIDVIKEETLESVALKESIAQDNKDDQQVKLAALLNDYIAQVGQKMERFENEIDNKLN